MAAKKQTAKAVPAAKKRAVKTVPAAAPQPQIETIDVAPPEPEELVWHDDIPYPVDAITDPGTTLGVKRIDHRITDPGTTLDS